MKACLVLALNSWRSGLKFRKPAMFNYVDWQSALGKGAVNEQRLCSRIESPAIEILRATSDPNAISLIAN